MSPCKNIFFSPSVFSHTSSRTSWVSKYFCELNNRTPSSIFAFIIQSCILSGKRESKAQDREEGKTEERQRMGIFWNNADRKPLEQKMKREGRLPPGQSLTLKWPVLHYAEVPRFDPEAWEFRTSGLVEVPLRLNWKEFLALPQVQVTSDFHCVTRWSRFDNHWEGVPFRAIHDLTEPLSSAAYVLVHGEGEYTTNVALADLLEAN